MEATVLTVTFGEGDILAQMHNLKLSALRNHDVPALWRLTDRLMELALSAAKGDHGDRWPTGWVTESRLFNVPVDVVGDMPHLLCENYMIYPYTVPSPRLVLH
jgi:hypothetical protein